MNLSSGFLRLFLVLYGLVATGMIVGMFLFGYGRPDHVNWYLFFVLSAMLISILWPSKSYNGESNISTCWKNVGFGPVRTIIVTASFALGAIATGVWGMQYVKPDASALLVLFFMIMPIITGLVGWIAIKGVEFIFGGFK